MSLVQFRYRKSIPTDPVKGSFYWVDLEDKIQIWFSPDGISENLVLLSNEVDESIISRIAEAEGNIETINEILNGLNISEFIKLDDLAEYAKISDIPDLIELTDSDYDIIVERVNEKIVPPLKWIEI